MPYTPYLFLAAILIGLGACFWQFCRRLDMSPVTRSVVLDGMEDLVLVVDVRGRVVDLNEAARKALGAGARRAIGRPAQMVVGPWGGSLDKYADQPAVEVFLGTGSRQRSYDLSVSPITAEIGLPPGKLIVMRDATERKRAQAEILQQTRTWAVLEERERLEREVAELLHSRVQSRLLVACYQIEQCEKLAESEPLKARDVLANVRELIEEIREKEIRQASSRLHPAATSERLVPTVRSLVAEFAEYFRVDVHVDRELAKAEGPLHGRISLPLRLAAYRVVEEGLNNIYRHARATAAIVSLRLESNRYVTVSVEDNGHGFDTSRLRHGLGLSSIAARVEQALGTWQIASTPGRGTVLTARLPLDSDQQQSGIPA